MRLAGRMVMVVMTVPVVVIVGVVMMGVIVSHFPICYNVTYRKVQLRSGLSQQHG